MTLPTNPFPGGERVTTPNPRQLEAISHDAGPVQVVLAPGTPRIPHLCRLEIRLHGTSPPTMPGEVSLNRIRGGPASLLRWLETSLGLPQPTIASSSRVTRYASALARAGGTTYATSFSVDRWATAAELLKRRDALLLAGWTGRDHAALPPIVRDLSKAEATLGEFPPGEAERLGAVLAALDAGQVLPAHECRLAEPIQSWPAAWRPVLTRLVVTLAPVSRPHASGGALREVQNLLLSAQNALTTPDGSVRWIAARSRLAACETVAAMLQASGNALAQTVVLCEDPEDALMLDTSLARIGLPTMGAVRRRGSEAPLAVLPLVLGLCWAPVDPFLLYEFLTLPVSPIPAQAARRLARALEQQPGYGSAAWDAAHAELVDPANDPEGKIHARLGAWFQHARAPIGEPLPYEVLSAVCARVSQWAIGRARRIETEEPESSLVPLYNAAGGQAAALAELAGNQTEPLTEPQVSRMLEAVQVSADARPMHAALAGGPALVHRLEDVPPGTKSLIWFGLSTRETTPSAWTIAQLNALQIAGVDIDDGTANVRILRAEQRAAVAGITDYLLLVQLPTDEAARPHPVWVHARCVLDTQGPIFVEDATESPAANDTAPWHITQSLSTVEAHQPLRPEWNVPAELIGDLEFSSATELEARLACPAKWLFDRQAKLRPRGLGALPEGPLLFGNLCHDVLARVFAAGGQAPDIEAAIETVGACFDERVQLDAPALTQPARASQLTRLRTQLLRSARTFVELLHAGEYQVKRMEAPIDAKIDDRPLVGYIDCVLSRGENEAILDFKYGSDTKYRALLEEGRATQLATYAYARGVETGRKDIVEGVGYLILTRASILTPDGSPLQGARPRDVIPNSPSIHETWDEFATALRMADAWLRGETPVPARPLQSAAQWPAGARLLLRSQLAKGEVQDVCKYCEHSRLCGLEEVA